MHVKTHVLGRMCIYMKTLFIVFCILMSYEQVFVFIFPYFLIEKMRMWNIMDPFHLTQFNIYLPIYTEEILISS